MNLIEIIKEAKWIGKLAIEFPNQEAYTAYMKAHPNADPKNHSVKEQKPKTNDEEKLEKKIKEKEQVIENKQKFTNGEVYHATAEGFAKSIMDKGLLTSKAHGGMTPGVYASSNLGQAFMHGTQAAIDEFQQGMREGRYKPEDSKNLKVMLVIADRTQFPEDAYGPTKTEENTVFRSRKDIPSSAFKRVEIYSLKDADKYRKQYEEAKYSGGSMPAMPKPIKIMK